MRMSVPPNALDLDRSGTSSQPKEAKSTRTRSGLFGFFRPQKTVSPLTHQGLQDVANVAKSKAPALASGMEDRSQDLGNPTESCSAWSSLPEHLIESVMQMLQSESRPPLHHSNKAVRQVLCLQLLCFLSQMTSLPEVSTPGKSCICLCLHVVRLYLKLLHWMQTQFAVTSVSKNWRQIGRRAFFRGLWDTSGAIQHPVQLFGLVSTCRSNSTHDVNPHP